MYPNKTLFTKAAPAPGLVVFLSLLEDLCFQPWYYTVLKMRLTQSLSFDRQGSETRCLYSNDRYHSSTEDGQINKKSQDRTSHASKENGNNLLGFRHNDFLFGTEWLNSVIKVAWRFSRIAKGCIIKAKREMWAGGDLQTWKLIKGPWSPHMCGKYSSSRKNVSFEAVSPWGPHYPWTLALAYGCWDYNIDHHAQPPSTCLRLVG